MQATMPAATFGLETVAKPAKQIFLQNIDFFLSIPATAFGTERAENKSSDKNA